MTDAEKIKELEAKVKSLEKSNILLSNKVDSYENGDKSLFHAVQRKMNELSKILNKHNLDEVDIDDAKNKTFDRISAILEKCEKYALSANALGSRIGIENNSTNGEAIVRRITSPESIADVLGNSAGQPN
jgi:exonuclease VII small subunit